MSFIIPKKSIDYQLKTSLIDDITAKHIHTINYMLGRAIRKEACIGELGKLPIKGLTEKQSKYALDLVKKLQKKNRLKLFMDHFPHELTRQILQNMPVMLSDSVTLTSTLLSLLTICSKECSRGPKSQNISVGWMLQHDSKGISH